MKENSTFSTYMPIKLTKSIDGDGKEQLKMRGMMSSTSMDSDGQILDPTGFNMDKFMKGGYMNWHHQSNKNPMAIIGKPTGYNLDKGTNQMWVDFNLFPDNPMAQQVYQLQEVLEKQDLTLGLSLEGQATKFRDPNRKKYVEKADITGCAVTPAPKNKDAIVQLVKGQEDAFELIKGDLISSGTGSQVGDGKHPLAKESLDEDERDTTEDKEKKKKLSKSEVFEIIGKRFPGSTYSTLEKFFNFTLELEKSNNIDIMKKNDQNGVDPNTLNKALEELGVLSKGEGTPGDDAAKSSTETGVESRLDALEKGIVNITDILVKGGSYKDKKMSKSEEDDDDDDDKKKKEMEKGDDKDMKKGNDDASVLLKGLFNGLETSLTGKLDTFGTTLTKANESIEAGNTRMASIEAKLEKAEADIEAIGGQSEGKKTITTKNFLKKGGDAGVEGALNSLNPVTDKRFILDTLEKAAIKDGQIVDSKLANALVQFETGNVLSMTLEKGLQSAGFSITK